MRLPDVVNMAFGSHLYGLNTPLSDYDYKGIYLPTLNELLLGNYPKSYKVSTGNAHKKNAPGDVDTEVMSLPYFVKYAIEGQTFAIDMLHCKAPLYTSPIWEDLAKNRTKFYSKNLQAFVGYVKRQAAKYGIKGSRLAEIKSVLDTMQGTLKTSAIIEYKAVLPIGEHTQWVTSENNGVVQTFYEVCGRKYQSTLTIEKLGEALINMYDSYGDRAKLAESNDGVDWKAVSHALRAGYQARDIYKDGDFEYPLKETDFLLKVKTGQLDYKAEVAPVLEDLVSEVDALTISSLLPESIDKAFWDDWLLEVYYNGFGI